MNYHSNRSICILIFRNKFLTFVFIRFPFNYTISPIYEITYFFSASSDYAVTVCYCGLSPLFIGVSLHISGQFDIVSSQLRNIMNEQLRISKRMSDSNMKEEQQLKVKLTNFIEYHIQIIQLGELMSSTFAPIVFTHFLAASIVICVCCVMIFLAQGFDQIIYQCYLMGQLFDTFTFAYGGTSLIEASNRVRDAAYSFDWYKYDVKNQKLILMIMLRAQKATAVKIPFLSASLETFLRVRILCNMLDQFKLFPCRSCSQRDHTSL